MSWQIYTYINVHTFRHSREFSPKETLYRNWSGCQQSYEIEHLIEQLSNIRLLSEEQQLKQEAQLEHRQSIKQQLTERFRELRACVPIKGGLLGCQLWDYKTAEACNFGEQYLRCVFCYWSYFVAAVEFWA